MERRDAIVKVDGKYDAECHPSTYPHFSKDNTFSVNGYARFLCRGGLYSFASSMLMS